MPHKPKKLMGEASAWMNHPPSREAWVLERKAGSQREPPPNLSRRIAHASHVQKVMVEAYTWMNHLPCRKI